MDCIVFPQVRFGDGKIQEIRFPNALLQGELSLEGNGDGVLEFADNLLFRGKFEQFQPVSDLAILEHHNAVLCASKDYEEYILYYEYQHYWKSKDFLVALTENTRFAGDFAYNYANGFGLLLSGPSERISSAYFGEFQNGFFHGRGIYLKISGTNLNRFNRFEGYFVDGERNGSGCLCLGGGEWLVGQFLMGQKVGFFLYVGACGELEFRLYYNDICKRSYKSQRYYISSAFELKYLQLESVEFDVAVAYFKFLEQSCVPCQSVRSPKVQSVPEVDTIWRYCKMTTVPHVVGLISDYRVCNHIISEGIAELAREACGIDYCAAEEVREPLNEHVTTLFKQIEQVKSSVIGNYEILRFLFNFYRARDLLVYGERVKAEYNNTLLKAIGDAQKMIEQRRRARHAKQAAQPAAQKLSSQKQEPETSDTMIPAKNNSSQQLIEFMEPADDDQPRVSTNKYHSGELAGYQELQNVDDNVSEVSDSLEGDYYKTLTQLAETLAIMPQGNNSRDNELLETFFSMLDANLAISVGSVKQFVFDLAAHFEMYAQVFPQERVIDAIIQNFAQYADSYQIILYYDIQSLLNSATYVLDFNNFVLLTLGLYYHFGFATPAQFMQEVVFIYAKATITQLIAVLDYDQMALSTLFDPEDAFFRYVQQARNRQGTPNRRGKLDNDNASVAQSQISKMMSSISKNGRDRAKAPMVPKILLRDASNMLTDLEQTMFRCRDLPEKLQQLIYLNVKYEYMFVFRPFINQKVEYLINQEFGITIMYYLDIADVNLQDFVFIFFDTFNNIFGFPRISEDHAFYFTLLAPFFIRFQQERCETFVSDAIKDKCKYLITHLSCFWMNQPILTAILACCLLKVDFEAGAKEPGNNADKYDEPNEETEEPNSDLLSSNSFTSLAETALSAQSSQSQGMSFRQMQYLKINMFERKWDTFNKDAAVEMVGQVLKAIIELWRRGLK